MSNKQPEALRLADELVETPFQSTKYIAAAELRRLHEVNQELMEALVASEALMRHMDKVIDGEFGDCRSEYEMETDNAWSAEVYKARVAIDKATGDTT